MTTLYLRLALDSIRKSRRLYVPYVLTGCSMVAVVYILAYLTSDPGVLAIRESAMVSSLLGMGVIVMGVFSTVFMLYTNSFLMKRRGKELGLYNVLGMTKWHILRVVFWETLICAALAIGVGLLLGVLLSKLSALALIKLMGGVPTSEFSIPLYWLALTAAGFGGLYLLIFLRSAINVLRVRPLELMRQTQAGEKPPKGNILAAAFGVMLLLSGYALALRVDNPLEALSYFFVAVILVILGTYACFRSASVYVLSLLRRNRRYYYQANHFISVSGMAYRMKRNGDSLATICILLTMVLVMMCSTTCLYFGIEGALRSQYPYQIHVLSDSETVPPFGEMQAFCENWLAHEGVTTPRTLYYRGISFAAMLDERTADITVPEVYDMPSAFTVIPLEDYNAAMGANIELAEGEVAIGGSLERRVGETLSFFGGAPYRVAQRSVPATQDADASIFGITSSLLVIVPGAQDLQTVRDTWNGTNMRIFPTIQTAYSFDTELSEAAQLDVSRALHQALRDAGYPDVTYGSMANARPGYRNMTVGFLFLGILLSLAFLCATALSMYYKQITEGLEDQARYDIMRRVGLSRHMIRQSINSQLLAVFFSPLIMAGSHLAFAFPMLALLLTMFGLLNKTFLALTTLATFGVLAAIYAIMYAITSRVYYRIVAGLSQNA